jgi:hypothetical protein
VTFLEKDTQMTHENQAQLFMRVLLEEFETHRIAKSFGFTHQLKAKAKRFRERRNAGYETSADPTEPLDCLQLMSSTPQRRMGR